MNIIKEFNINIDEVERLVNGSLDGLEFLGEGSSRIVYAMNDDIVLKIPKNDFGNAQNQNEHKIYKRYKDTQYQEFLAPCFNLLIGDKQVNLMVRTEPISEEMELEVEFSSLSMMIGVFGKEDQYKLFTEFLEILLDNSLLEGDLHEMSSWGFYKSIPILIDYGCTEQIFQNIKNQGLIAV